MKIDRLKEVTPQERAYRKYIQKNYNKFDKDILRYAKLGVRRFVHNFKGKEFTEQDIIDTMNEEIRLGKEFFSNLKA